MKDSNIFNLHPDIWKFMHFKIKHNIIFKNFFRILAAVMSPERTSEPERWWWATTDMFKTGVISH